MKSHTTQHVRERMVLRQITWPEIQRAVEYGKREPQTDGTIRYTQDGVIVVVGQNTQTLITVFREID